MRLAVLINSTAHTYSHTQSATQIQLEEATPKKVGPIRGLILVVFLVWTRLGRKSISIFRPRAIAARKMPKGATKRSGSCNTHTLAHTSTSLITQTQARGAVLDKSCVKVF